MGWGWALPFSPHVCGRTRRSRSAAKQGRLVSPRCNYWGATHHSILFHVTLPRSPRSLASHLSWRFEDICKVSAQNVSNESNARGIYRSQLTLGPWRRSRPYVRSTSPVHGGPGIPLPPAPAQPALPYFLSLRRSMRPSRLASEPSRQRRP